jgi:hypothetical protein
MRGKFIKKEQFARPNPGGNCNTGWQIFQKNFTKLVIVHADSSWRFSGFFMMILYRREIP